MFGDFTALVDVTLDILEGEFVCFLGRSGCGKTTLLRAIAGLDFQTSGRIYQKGRDISDVPPADRDFGIVFQSYALFPNLTVKSNIAYGLVNRKIDRKAVVARVNELLDLVGLTGSDDKYPAALSGGMRKRVGLARAICMEPAVVLYDEPTTGLDPIIADTINDLMVRLQKRLSITSVVVTHDMRSAFFVADRIAMLSEGLIRFVGTSEEMEAEDDPIVREFLSHR